MSTEDHLRRSLEVAAEKAIRPSALGLAAVFAVIAVAHAFLVPPAAARILIPVAGATSLIAAGVALALRSRHPPDGWVHATAAVLPGLGLVNSFTHLVLVQDPSLTTSLVLVLLGAATLLLSLPWFLGVLGTTAMGWALVAWAARPDQAWLHFGFLLLMSSVLAGVVQIVRLRTICTLETLRLEERASRDREGRSARLFQLAVEHASDSITILGADNRILYQSPALAGTLGYHPEDVTGEQGFGFVHPDDVASVIAATVATGATDDRTPPVEYRLRHADGSWRTVETVGRRFLSDEGTVHVLAITRDVTARAQTAQDLARAKEEAEAASRAKSEFLAMMSHELRTPMNAVIGMADMLLDSPLTSEQHSFADTVRRSGEALLHIINDLLDFSKLESGHVEFETIPFSPRELVDSVLGLLAARAQTKGLALEVRLAPSVPAQVLGDPTRVRQVLTNLVANGIKFTERGAVSIAVAAEPLADAGLLLHVTVTDTGIGLSSAEQARLFKPFSQADSSTTRRFGGTGLGLAICARLVALMGGTINVESEPGRGSTFCFTVRVAPAPARAAAELTRDESKPEGRTDRLEVLVVEDNPVNQHLAVAMLRRLGHQPTVAENGRAALATLAQGHFDLILMDCLMPEMDGFETTRAIRIREHGSERHIPIVALTANALTGDRERCLAAGMDDYLAKPTRMNDLAHVIARWAPRSDRSVPTPTPSV